jgi:hypothetical protein
MKVTALSGYKLSLPTMLVTTALLLQSCQSQPEIQTETVQVEFSEPPIANISSTTWDLMTDTMSFQENESTLSNKETAPWWGGKEIATKFINEYFAEHFLNFYLEQEGLSSDMEVGIGSYLPDDAPVVKGTPYVAYEKSEDGIRALAIHEPSIVMTEGMQPAMLFPIVPTQISVEESVIYLTANSSP